MTLRNLTALAILLAGPVQPLARGDGGTLRISQVRDGLQITVFTSPSPLRAGWVDVSVLVQEKGFGTIRSDLPVDISASRSGGFQQTVPATPAAATNKLFRAAQFDLDRPGRWHLEILVHSESRPICVDCDIDVDEPLPPWMDLALWIGWPALAICLFGAHRGLVRRRRAYRPLH